MSDLRNKLALLALLNMLAETMPASEDTTTKDVPETTEGSEPIKNDRVSGAMIISFHPNMPQGLIFANGYRIGRAVEAWKAGNNQRGFDLCKINDSVLDIMTGSDEAVHMQLTLITSEGMEVIEEALNNLSAELKKLSDKFGVTLLSLDPRG